MQPDRARLPRPEELLSDYARRLQRHRAGRRVLWFHLSRLARQNRHESDIQLAANQLVPLANQFQGEVFALASGDVVVVLKDPNAKEVDAAVFALRFALAQDPLMQRADGEGTHVFLTAYDMADRYDAFLARVNDALNGESNGPEVIEAAVPEGLGERLVLSRAEMHRLGARAAAVTGHINTSQGRIAVERLLERREIAALDGPRPRRWGLRETVRLEAVDAFDTLAMALARHQVTTAMALSEVERTLLPGMPEHLKATSEPHHILALHIDALMSPEFLLFDRQLGAAKAGRPSLAFWGEELSSNRETADYLKSFLGERGYRLGVTGIAATDLNELSGLLAGFKFIELDHPKEIDARDAELLRRLVTHFGADNVILADLRSQKALASAQSAGITRACGPVIDQAL